MFGRFGTAARRWAMQSPASPAAVASTTNFVRAAGALTAGALTVGAVAHASGGHELHPPALPWSHSGWTQTYDHASLRRGFEVYRNVCSTCHSMDLLHYRELIGVTHSEEHAKALCSIIEVTDGPNDQGEMFQRPGKLSDHFPRPYVNPEAARAANGGALPPDLSCIVKARPGAEDYIFALLTGYRDPPAGVTLLDGMHYNPYFTGGAIAMAKPLSDGQVDFEDGTPSTESQMAKDVSTFLAWASEPSFEERKMNAIKFMGAVTVMGAFVVYAKRWKWGPIKTRKIEWTH